MKHHDQEASVESYQSSSDGVVDAVAAFVIVLSVAAMGLLWVSGQ